MAFLLSSGRNNIVLKRSLVGKHIGLLPIGQPVNQVTTKGLQWDIVQGQVLKFGDLVSTSNTFPEESESSTIVVNTDGQLIFTIDFPPCHTTC